MDARSYAFDAEEIAAGIADWVRIESPSTAFSRLRCTFLKLWICR